MRSTPVEELLTPGTRALLDTLLRQENADEAAAGNNEAYKLTLMKKQRPKEAELKRPTSRFSLGSTSWKIMAFSKSPDARA